MKKKNSKEILKLKEIQKDSKDSLINSSKIDRDSSLQNNKYSTGIFSLDKLLDGGFPQGRIVGLGAEWNVGKTIMLMRACDHIIEKYNKKIYYIEIAGESAFELSDGMGFTNNVYDPQYNPDGTLYLMKLETIKDVEETIKKVTGNDDTSIVIIDFDNRLFDNKSHDEENSVTSNKVAISTARKWSKAITSIKAIIESSNTCLILAHQAREKPRCFGASVELSTNKNQSPNPFALVDMSIFFNKTYLTRWFYKNLIDVGVGWDPTKEEYDGTISYITRKGRWIHLNIPSVIQTKVENEETLWETFNNHYDAIKKYLDKQHKLDIYNIG